MPFAPGKLNLTSLLTLDAPSAAQVSSSAQNTEVNRHHPYVRESRRGNNQQNFERIEYLLRNSEKLVSQLKAQLEEANGSIACEFPSLVDVLDRTHNLIRLGLRICIVLEQVCEEYSCS